MSGASSIEWTDARLSLARVLLPVARATDRLDVEPVRTIVSAVVIVLVGWLPADKARKVLRSSESAGRDRVRHGVSSHLLGGTLARRSWSSGSRTPARKASVRETVVARNVSAEETFHFPQPAPTTEFLAGPRPRSVLVERDATLDSRNFLYAADASHAIECSTLSTRKAYDGR